MMKDQLVIDHLLHSRSYLETTSMTTEDPLENTADLLFTTVPAAASSIVAGVTTKLNNDTLEQTTDLLYHAATISLCPRPRATAQLLEERRLALLRAHLTSVSEDTYRFITDQTVNFRTQCCTTRAKWSCINGGTICNGTC